jgi:hypothetical protein
VELDRKRNRVGKPMPLLDLLKLAVDAEGQPGKKGQERNP